MTADPDADAPAVALLGGVERRVLSFQLVPAELFAAECDRIADADVFERQVEFLVLFPAARHILEADRKAVHAELFRCGVELALHHQRLFCRRPAAERAGDRRVRADDLSMIVHVWNAVAARRLTGQRADIVARVADVSARVERHIAVNFLHLAVRRVVAARAHAHRAAHDRVGHRLAAGIDELDGAAEFFGDERRDGL